MSVANHTRVLAGECTAMLKNLSRFSVMNGEMQRTPLALLGNYANTGGVPGTYAGVFRSGFHSNVTEVTNLVNENTKKVHSMVVKYLPRSIESEVEDTYAPCTNNAKDEEREQIINTSNFITRVAKVTINKGDFLTICENPDEAIMRRVLTKINAALTSMDKALMGRVINGAGANIAHSVTAVPDPSDINDYKAINITDTNRNPKWAGVDQLLEDLEENEWGSYAPAVLFSNKGAYASYIRAQNIGCCNDRGENVMAVAQKLQFAPFRSKSVSAAFTTAGLTASNAANSVLLMNPGSAHVLEYWDNDHTRYNQGETFTNIWEDPFSQEKFDFEVQWDSCTKDYIISLYMKKDVFTLPTDMYKTGDDLALTNGIMLYNMGRG